VGRIGTDMTTDFFEVDRLDRPCVLIEIFQPAPKTQEAHASTIVSGVLQQDGAA
jgi:hypothetical protein